MSSDSSYYSSIICEFCQQLVISYSKAFFMLLDACAAIEKILCVAFELITVYRIFNNIIWPMYPFLLASAAGGKMQFQLWLTRWLLWLQRMSNLGLSFLSVSDNKPAGKHFCIAVQYAPHCPCQEIIQLYYQYEIGVSSSVQKNINLMCFSPFTNGFMFLWFF